MTVFGTVSGAWGVGTRMLCILCSFLSREHRVWFTRLLLGVFTLVVDIIFRVRVVTMMGFGWRCPLYFDSLGEPDGV